MRNEILCIEPIQDNISITVVTCSENYNLKIRRQISENLSSIGSNIDRSFNGLSSWKFDRQFNIIGRIKRVITVDKSLVQIENHSLFI